MSMTIKEAIRCLHLPGDHLRDYEEYGIDIDDDLREAMQMGIDALREKAEREDPKPLTLEELRQMDGEPVWIDDWWEDSHGWELSMDASDYFEGERRTEKEYGSIWVAYRHKPRTV